MPHRGPSCANSCGRRHGHDDGESDKVDETARVRHAAAGRPQRRVRPAHQRVLQRGAPLESVGGKRSRPTTGPSYEVLEPSSAKCWRASRTRRFNVPAITENRFGKGGRSTSATPRSRTSWDLVSQPVREPGYRAGPQNPRRGLCPRRRCRTLYVNTTTNRRSRDRWRRNRRVERPRSGTARCASNPMVRNCCASSNPAWSRT